MNELENLENANESLQNEEISSEITETAAETGENNQEENIAAPAEVNYAEIIKADTDSLKAIFPELRGIKDVSELDNPLRYAALRDLGLTPEEAYLATRKRTRGIDNRSHLYPSPSVSAHDTGAIPEADMRAARELFSDISDSEIRRLYKKVTK